VGMNLQEMCAAVYKRIASSGLAKLHLSLWFGTGPVCTCFKQQYVLGCVAWGTYRPAQRISRPGNRQIDIAYSGVPGESSATESLFLNLSARVGWNNDLSMSGSYWVSGKLAGLQGEATIRAVA